MLTDYSVLVTLKHALIKRPEQQSRGRFERTFLRRIGCLLDHHGTGLVATGPQVEVAHLIFEERCCLRCGAQVWSRVR